MGSTSSGILQICFVLHSDIGSFRLSSIGTAVSIQVVKAETNERDETYEPCTEMNCALSMICA